MTTQHRLAAWIVALAWVASGMITVSAQEAARAGARAGSAPSSGGSFAGIQVHGHWTIDVRNPDGSLVSHTEFDNAYVPTSRILAEILGGRKAPGRWQVILSGEGGPCGESDGTVGACSLQETLYYPFPQTDYAFKTLAVTAPGPIELAGWFTVTGLAFTPKIDLVQTSLATCFEEIAPRDCVQDRGLHFPPPLLTSHSLHPTPIAVKKDQFVQVKVVISFTP